MKRKYPIEDYLAVLEILKDERIVDVVVHSHFRKMCFYDKNGIKVKNFNLSDTGKTEFGTEAFPASDLKELMKETVEEYLKE